MDSKKANEEKDPKKGTPSHPQHEKETDRKSDPKHEDPKHQGQSGHKSDAKK